jgi:hypothetical protein
MGIRQEPLKYYRGRLTEPWFLKQHETSNNENPEH